MKKFKIVLIVIIALLIVPIGYILYSMNPIPKKDTISINCPEVFTIENENMFEEQEYNKCAAFAVAYLLRFSGIQAEGSSVYNELGHKIPISGYVWPKGIIEYLDEKGLKPIGLKGNLLTLKSRLAMGKPVIVLTGKSFDWQHYIVLVGYDSTLKEMYYYDSRNSIDLNDDMPGNITMREEHFMSSWKNGLPVFNKFYIVIE